MAAQPTEENILLMISLSNLPRQEAIARLKGNNNDVSQAINELYEDPDSSKRYTWDEGQFNSDRDGSNDYDALSFQVQGPDDHGSNTFLGAPSRPPSRNDTTSPMSRVIDLGDAHSQANPRSRMTQAELADDELQKALAESAQEAGLAPQEFGVTSTDTVHFGPANRSNYDKEQWQMVHVGSAATQSAADPEPANRQRERGTPAFFKPNSQSHRLASILTIYHEIPLGREVFLDRENLLPDFGHNKEWWMGKPIDSTKIKWRAANGNMANMGADADNAEMIHELQRLMAFLDLTDRSYGSVDVLTDLDVVKNADGLDYESKFLGAWRKAQLGKALVGSIFSTALQPANASLDFDPEVDAYHEFAILDLDLPTSDDIGELNTLYDLADKVLWMSSGLDISTSAYLTHVGDIIGFRLKSLPSSKGVEIPEIWYPDRYLEAGREASLEMRKQKADIRELISKISSMENKLTYFTTPEGKVVEVKTLFETSLMHDAESLFEDSSIYSPLHTIGSDELNPEQRVGDQVNLSEELQKVMRSIDAKLKALDEEKEKARSSLRELSKLYTEPSKILSGPPLHKYKLCGVSTKQNVTYLRRQTEPDLIDMDIDGTGLYTERSQWWKIGYMSTEPNPVSVSKVTMDNVIEAAMQESSSPILVYASEKALSVPFEPLPSTLDSFVRADNLAFKGELQVEVAPSPQNSFLPKSPPKRKYDDDSHDTLPRYDEESRWGGMSPLRDHKDILISHQEVLEFDENDPRRDPASASESGGESVTPRGNVAEDVIMGQDPRELVDVSDASLIPSGSKQATREMEEKGGMLSLLPSSMDGDYKKLNLTQSMDVDDITGP